MAAHTYSILFYLKDKRLDKNGKASIYVRITVDGRRAALSLKRKVAPEHWDSRMNKMKGKDDEAKELNYYMTTIRHKLN
ncbi:MAG: Arm DNA-binding domain-containing protein, partial [Maribacter sp.]|nr:Arm DNA-binding domain-containing protein [Maribacter sp.]